MQDSVLKKYTGQQVGAEAVESIESAGLDDLGAFGWLRGVRDRAVMLELRHKDGKIEALGYAWLEHAEFNPSDGITLHFAGRTVRIIGRNLNKEARANVRLFAGIVRHRVPWIQEADEPMAFSATKGATVIDQLKVN